VPDVQVTIDRLAFGGNGVARINGKVCFVPFSCPGDELAVRVVSEKRSYLTAAITRVIRPGADRVTPPCPLFGLCGGCNWQHVAYERQLSEKQAIFSDTLWRGARVSAEKIGAIVPAPSTYGYRKRVQFKLGATKSGLRIGFYRTASHYAEDVGEGCSVATREVNAALFNLRGILSSFPEPDKIPQINIDATERTAVAIVNYTGADKDGIAAFFERYRSQLGDISGLYLRCGKKSFLQKIYGDDLLEYFLPGDSDGKSRYSLVYKPGDFAQTNSVQNAAILAIIRNFANAAAHDRILDLYCGNGNFSLPLAGSVSHVTGIEECSGSVESARENARRNGNVNAEFLCATAALGLRRLAEEGRPYSTVILDPPRTGAADALFELLRLGPEKIIYVSCDPASLARDCGILIAGGYDAERCVPVDMFPQTHHLESVTLLRRRTKI